MNSINNNLVKNRINNFANKEEELKQKKIQDELDQAEKKARAQITIEKTMQMQKAKLEAKRENDAKEAENKRIQKEEKEKKEKEFAEKNDKARVRPLLSHYSWRDDVRDKIKRSYSNNKFLSKKSEDQEVTILMDFSSNLGNIVISGYEEEMITHQFPNCITYYDNPELNIFESYVCEEIRNNYNRISGNVLYPVKKGVFEDYDLLELLIGYTINNKINFDFFEECGIIFKEPTNIRKEDRKKIAEILFETFNISKLFLIKPSVLTLLKEGKYTGIVVQLDEDISNFMPVFDCFQIDHASIKSDFCRKKLIDYMKILLTEEDYYFMTNYPENIFGSIVNQSCYVALDYEKELHNIKSFSYKLPDGKEINIKEPRIKCLESFIEPSTYIKNTSNENQSTLYNLKNSINKCDKDIQSELYNNIFLTGENSKYKGLKERLEKELRNHVNTSWENDIKVSYSEHEVENGIEAFFSKPEFKDMWISREEYEDKGYPIVNTKFV